MTEPAANSPRFDRPSSWTLEYILRDLPPGESGRHDYKSTGILLNESGHPDRSQARNKLGKHISAFANYEGGFIILGIDDPEGSGRRRLTNGVGVPRDLTPNGTKDWLQDVCYTATDPVSVGVEVHLIPALDDRHAVYVIHVPPGRTAYQSAQDQRYYERFGSKSVPIGAQKVLDIIQRPQHPIVAARLHIRHRDGTLEVAFLNIGPIMARYAAIHIELPVAYQFDTIHTPAYQRPGYRVHIIKATTQADGGRGDYDPLFPHTQRYFRFTPSGARPARDPDAEGYYHIFADHAPPLHGSFAIPDIIDHAQTYRPPDS